MRILSALESSGAWSGRPACRALPPRGAGRQVAALYTASFKSLESGLTHLEFGEVEVPANEMKLQLHNFDYNTNN